MINIVNKHFHISTENDYCISRPTIFGNPWSHMDSKYADAIKTKTREEAIEKYIPHFIEQYKTDPSFKEAADTLVEIAKESDINLVCWCFPAKCHGDIIKKFIEYKLKKQKGELNV